MKIKNALFLLFSAIALLLASCDIFSGLNDSKKDSANTNLPEGQFWALDTNNQPYQVNAKKLAEGNRCEVWAEVGSGVTKGIAEDMVYQYENVIYNKIVTVFSKTDFIYNGKSFKDMMELSDYLTDRNGKLTILLLDIKDSYKNENDSYVAGYFFSYDFYNAEYSNGRDMMYIDTMPGLSNSEHLEAAYSTFAHELQHLINYTTRYYLTGRFPPAMDTWINEGLSTQAEFFYLNRNPEIRYTWLTDSRAKSIHQGNNFYVWGNHEDDPYAILDDYATAYLFFRWLYLHNNTDRNIFLDIATGNYTDYRAVTSVAKKINPAWSNWNTLLSTWMAANYAPGNDTYGYKGDTILKNPNIIKIKTIFTETRKITLYPGEGVYSGVNNTAVSLTDSDTNIKYAKLSANAAPVPITSGTVSGTAMLTYNANTANTGSTETGYLTGAAASVNPGPRSLAGSGGYNGPLVIDAWDILGRDRAALPLVPFRQQ